MIAEPYICIAAESPSVHGNIEWLFKHPDGKLYSLAARYNTVDVNVHLLRHSENWIPYADFEREKILELAAKDISAKFMSWDRDVWTMHRNNATIPCHCSWDSIGYARSDYENDSESSRLLKRAEFLKAVCEKEGVEWLPKDCGCPTANRHGIHTLCFGCGKCKCECYKPSKREKEIKKQDNEHIEEMLEYHKTNEHQKLRDNIGKELDAVYAREKNINNALNAIMEIIDHLWNTIEKACDTSNHWFKKYCEASNQTSRPQKCEHEWKPEMVSQTIWCHHCHLPLAEFLVERDYYSREEVDAKLKPFLEYLHDACTEKAEEYEFKKELLHALETRTEPMKISWAITLENLRTRFL